MVQEFTQLQREDFEKWLRSQPANFVVGYSNCGYNCPIQRFLTTEFAHIAEGFVVYEDGLYCRFLGENVLKWYLPVWAINFIQLVDGNNNDIPLTVEYCLSVLYCVV